MKTSLIDRTKLFGHYLFNQVKAGDTTIIMQSIDGNTNCVMGPANVVQLPIEECKLILKPLNSITKRDAMKCAELANLPLAMVKNWEVKRNIANQAIFTFPSEENTVSYSKTLTFTEDKLNFSQVDFLRQKGYAIAVPDDCLIIENAL